VNNLLLSQLPMAFFFNAFCVFHAAIQDAAALGSFNVDANVRVNFTKNFIVSTAFWNRSRVTEQEGRVANRDDHDRRVRIPMQSEVSCANRWNLDPLRSRPKPDRMKIKPQAWQRSLSTKNATFHFLIILLARNTTPRRHSLLLKTQELGFESIYNAHAWQAT
jgi:hypothetical protein